jgi:DNA-binding HxlR family transcriptional regulator
LTIGQVNERGDVATRAGIQVLTLVAAPINVAVLQALSEEPKSLVDLRRASGSPPQTTIRGHLKDLVETGILEKRRQDDFPGAVDYAVAGPGREMNEVVAVIRAWLAASPEGPIEIGSAAAKSAIRALIEGWSTRMIRALAARPLSLTELDQVISDVTYPSLERRLSALRLSGQVIPKPGRGRGTPYAVTDWLRKAVAPLAIAARWEHRHAPNWGAAITNRDVEAAFLLALPLLRLPADLTGTCRLAVEFAHPNGNRLAGVRAEVSGGRVASCDSRLEGPTTARVAASAGEWIDTVIDGDLGRLDVGGDRALAEHLLGGLHGALFGSLADVNLHGSI